MTGKLSLATLRRDLAFVSSLIAILFLDELLLSADLLWARFTAISWEALGPSLAFLTELEDTTFVFLLTFLTGDVDLPVD